MIETHDEAQTSLRYGIVVAIDEQAHRVRVHLPDLDLTTWWLAVLVPGSRGDKHYALPDIDEHVVCLLDRRGETGVVLGSLYSARDAVPVTGCPDRHHIRYRDGTTIDYDRRTHRLALSVRGPVEIVADGPITVTAPSVTIDSQQMMVTGHLKVQDGIDVSGGGGVSASVKGNVSVLGSIAASGSIMDAGGNSNHHSH